MQSPSDIESVEACRLSDCNFSRALISNGFLDCCYKHCLMLFALSTNHVFHVPIAVPQVSSLKDTRS